MTSQTSLLRRRIPTVFSTASRRTGREADLQLLPQHGLQKHVYEGPKYKRIAQFKHLLSTGQFDDMLLWNNNRQLLGRCTRCRHRLWAEENVLISERKGCRVLISSSHRGFAMIAVTCASLVPRKLQQHGLNGNLLQSNVGFSHQKRYASRSTFPEDSVRRSEDSPWYKRFDGRDCRFAH